MGRFRTILPFVHCGSAALFGGWGLWQRSAILSRPFLEGQTLGDSTARFHVWPWPYKFAVVANLPAFLAGLMSAWPVSSMWPKLPESAQLVPSLLCAVIFWRWVGSRLDRRWRVTARTPWIALLLFTLVCLAGAFLPLGYMGFIPYGIAVWMVTSLGTCGSTPDALAAQTQH